LCGGTKGVRPDAVEERIYAPVAHRMGVPEDVSAQEFGMDIDQAFWVQCATHIINVSFP